MNNEKLPWLHRPIHSSLPAITNEIVLFAGIILLAIFTRFYDLEARVMSHDESLHTYFSWLLYRGQGYQHAPMMHGPYQFHIIALTYFLFGVSDFTARIPAVLFSIATVWMVWYWRRYLGNWGMIVAALLMVISPYMLYYG
ncbi:MAG TPA: glycosyltransferase family 39 protein, partial [Anaerolineales bacterium]|nr:glycosyltransferase family 39 protein [Anaerolineales bacterium]